MERLRKSNLLLVTLVTGLVLLLVGGLALLAAYFYLSRQPAELAWVNPLQGVRGEAVAPDLAVLPLAGEPDDRVIQAALSVGEVETAYAGLAYSMLLPDPVRGGHWVLLGSHYLATDPARAAICFQAALDLAALSPALHDVARVELALQAATGFQTLKRTEVAELAAGQGEQIGRYSLVLLPAQRYEALRQVATSYDRLGHPEQAGALRADLKRASAGPGARVDTSPQLLADLRGSVVLPSAVASTMQARQQAAATLAARWLASGEERRLGMAQALGQALLTEDTARGVFYGQVDRLSSPDQLASLTDRVAWLTVKYRVARRDYGVSLLPDWEERLTAIRTELATAFTDLINLYGRRLDALGAAEALAGRVDLLRQGLLWTRLGLFPDHAEQALSGKLVETSQELWSRRGGAGLVAVVLNLQGQRFYVVSGSGPDSAAGPLAPATPTAQPLTPQPASTPSAPPPAVAATPPSTTSGQGKAGPIAAALLSPQPTR